MARGGLGKGLSSLIADAPQESQGEEGLLELSLELIAPNPDQPRTNFEEDGIEELADSISKVGLLQPILVRPVGDNYQIIAGERRWHACRAAGLEKVPVRIQNADDGSTLELALIENLQRKDLNSIEEARGYRRLIEVSGLTQGELADKVSKSRSTITNAIRLLDLPEEVQDLMFEGKLSAGHARAVLSLGDEDKRLKLANKIVAENLSVREAESLARLLSAGEGERPARPVTPRSFKLVARKLRQSLGANVRVKQTKDKKKIEIEFKDEEDLERIFNLISHTETQVEEA